MTKRIIDLDLLSSLLGTESIPVGDNTTTSRVTVNTLLTGKAPLASPAFTGTPTAPTASAGTNTTQLATTAFVETAVSLSESSAFENPMQQAGDAIIGGTAAYVDENASTASPTPVLAMSSGNDLSSSNNRGGGFYYNPTSLPAWVSFDLGADHTIVGHRMLARDSNASYGAAGYKVQYSTDNVNWNDAYVEPLGVAVGDTGDIPHDAQTARYWRFYQNANTTWQVNEFYLYSGVPGGVAKRAAGGGTTASIPASPILYQKYYDTTVGYTKIWNGSAWVSDDRPEIKIGTTSERNAYTPFSGVLWHDTTLRQTGFYDGSKWLDVGTWYQLGAIIGDTFSAADGTSIIGRVTPLGARTWTAFNGGSGTGTITSNQVIFGALAIVGLNVGQATYSVQFKAVSVPSGAGWYIRHNGGNTANGISLKNDAGTWKWYKDNVVAQTTGISYSANQTVLISVSGGTHTVTIGASSNQYTDSTYTALTYVGCYIDITIDNFEVLGS